MDVSTSVSQLVDLWNDEYDGKVKKNLKMKVIPAVEIEPPGCSFNPEVESHRDALAQAVANEMQKVYKDELCPELVPLIVEGEVVMRKRSFSWWLMMGLMKIWWQMVRSMMKMINWRQDVWKQSPLLVWS